jgi:glyoxylase I family protein
MLSAFHHVCLVASDYQEAVHFYVDLLGFQVYRQSYSQSKKRKKMELFLNGVYVLEVFIYDDGAEGVFSDRGSRIDHLSFLTTDVDGMMSHLSRNGVEVSPIFWDKQSGDKYFFFYNKDGIKHEIFGADGEKQSTRQLQPLKDAL